MIKESNRLINYLFFQGQYHNSMWQKSYKTKRKITDSQYDYFRLYVPYDASVTSHNIYFPANNDD